MLKKLLVGLSLLMAQACWAADTYNPATNQLSIPSVEVAGITYNNVLITVGSVIRIDGGNPSGSVDVYEAATNQLSIPSVLVNGSIYTNVLISVGQVISVGAGSSDGGTGTAVANPLKKYEATYYACDRNEKVILQMIPTGSNGLNITMSALVYSSPNCSGSIIGYYKWDSPALAVYQGVTTANLPPATIFKYSDTIDLLVIDNSSVTATLTGSGVNGSCVYYSYLYNNSSTSGKSCFKLSYPSTVANGAFYLTPDSHYLIQFELKNGIYQAQMMGSKTPSFNYDSLILD